MAVATPLIVNGILLRLKTRKDSTASLIDFQIGMVSDANMSGVLVIIVSCLWVTPATLAKTFLTGIHTTDNALAQKLGMEFVQLWDFQAVLTGVSVELTTNQRWLHGSCWRREVGELSSQ